MTLKEISADYYASANIISEKLHLLREELKTCENPEQKWYIKRRIAELTPILTELKKVGAYCEHYYEKGFYINDGPFTRSRTRGNGSCTKNQALAGAPYHIEHRADTPTKGSRGKSYISGSNNKGNCSGKKRKSIHDIKKLSQGL